jgi:hypothetical protein
MWATNCNGGLVTVDLQCSQHAVGSGWSANSEKRLDKLRESRMELLITTSDASTHFRPPEKRLKELNLR